MKDKQQVNKSVKTANDPTFFKPKKTPKNDGQCNQNVEVNVNVTVKEEDDCLTGCIKSIFKCGMAAAEGS